jgi:hypothetical protein
MDDQSVTAAGQPSEGDSLSTNIVADAPEPSAITAEDPPPAEPADEQLAGLHIDRLQELCRAAGLRVKGRKKHLIERLRALRSGQPPGGAAPGGLKKTDRVCEFCGAAVRVTGGTVNQVVGRTLVTIRYVQCRGKRQHRYKQVARRLLTEAELAARKNKNKPAGGRR